MPLFLSDFFGPTVWRIVDTFFPKRPTAKLIGTGGLTVNAVDDVVNNQTSITFDGSGITGGGLGLNWFDITQHGVTTSNSGAVNAANLQTLINTAVVTPGEAITLYHPGGNIPLDPLTATSGAQKYIYFSRTVNFIGVAGGGSKFVGGSYCTSQFTFAAGCGFWLPDSQQLFASGQQCDGSYFQDLQVTGNTIYSTLQAWASTNATIGNTLGKKLKTRWTGVSNRREVRRYYECIQTGTTGSSEPTGSVAAVDHTVLYAQLPPVVYLGHQFRDSAGMLASPPVFYQCTTPGTIQLTPPTMDTTVGHTTTDTNGVVWTTEDATGYWIVDGSVVWRCQYHSGFLVESPFFSAERVVVNGHFANAGFSILGNTGLSNANEPTLINCSITDCGGGVYLAGANSNAGSFYSLTCRNLTQEYSDGGAAQGGFGYWDGSQLGASFVACNAEATNGFGYVIGYLDWGTGGGGAATNLYGCYAEADCTLGNIGAAGLVVGGNFGSAWTVAGISFLASFLAPGQAVNTKSVTTGQIWQDLNGKHPYIQSDGQGGGGFMLLADTVDNTTPSFYTGWYYEPVALDSTSRAGWWCQVYGNRAAMQCVSGKAALEGPGWSWTPLGEFKGGSFTSNANRFFVATDAAAAITPRLRKNGHWTVGDRADLVGTGAVGTWNGWVISSAGYRGVEWTAGKNCFSATTFPGVDEQTIIEPTVNTTGAVNGFPVPGSQVWACTTAGIAGGSEPTWPVSPTPGVTTQTDGAVTWTYLGVTPTYERLGFIDDIVIHQIPQTETAWKDSTATDSASVAAKTTVRNRRTSTATTSNATGQVLETYTLPDNSTTQIDVVVTGKRSGAHASAYKLSGTYYRDAGGNATIIGSVTKSSNKVGNSASQDANLAISGHTVTVTVDPDETQNWNWSVSRTGVEGAQ